MQIVRICSISVTLCVPFFGYIGENRLYLSTLQDIHTPRPRRVEREGPYLSAYRVCLVISFVAESAAYGRDGVKAEKDRLRGEPRVQGKIENLQHYSHYAS